MHHFWSGRRVLGYSDYHCFRVRLWYFDVAAGILPIIFFLWLRKAECSRKEFEYRALDLLSCRRNQLYILLYFFPFAIAKPGVLIFLNSFSSHFITLATISK